MFEKKYSPCKQEFPGKKNRKHLLGLYLPSASTFNITSHYDIFATKNLPPQSSNRTPNRIQTDDIEFDFSKFFTGYIVIIQHRSSRRANSIFAIDVFSLIYSYISILESNETFYASPPQISRHAIVRQELNAFLLFLISIRETLTNNEKSKIVKVDLQKVLAWFKIEYF